MKTNLFEITKNKIALLFISVLFQGYVNAQVATIMADINTGLPNSSPTLFTSCGIINTVFFVADNGTTGQELWKYDITTGISSLVKDINPGSAGSGITVITANFANNGILFNANDGTNGNELWKSDGTAAGTAMVLDINTGSGSSNPVNFYPFGGVFIFSADNGINGKEPWLTNGTFAATVLLKDINPGINASDPNNFTAVGTNILFRANDGAIGSELWITDMTASNTLLLKDINSGSAPSIPSNFAVVGTTLFFSATDVTNGAELWKSNGTLAGTQLVKDINAGTGNSINTSPGAKAFFTGFNNAVYFQASDGSNGYELWKSDGSVAGTTLVKDIQAGSGSSTPSGIFATSSNLFFAANDGTNGFEVWMSDGSTAGTSLLKDINIGSASSTTITTTFIQTGNGIIYFTANNGVNGNELWRTLGSTVTTTLLADINPGASNSSPGGFMQYNNYLYFSANDGTAGIEPWSFDPNPPTGINTLTKSETTFDMYPNPCNERVTIACNEPTITVQMFSVLGQLALSQINIDTAERTIDIRDLKSGIYIIKVISEKGEYAKKLIVN